MIVGKLHSLIGQAINVGRMYLTAVGAQVGIPQIVSEKDDNIRLL